MDAEQLRELLQAARGGRKPEAFSSGDALDWINWRSQFSTCVRICGWRHKRARLEIEACLTGAAKTRTLDIVAVHRPALGVDEDEVPDFELMLNALEARFMPAAASDLARATFRHSKQTENESHLDFHARLRIQHRRAYPNLAADAVETDHNLIDTFCAGLLNPEVRSDVIKQRPQTYAEALNIASNMQAAAQIIGNEVKSEPELNAVGIPSSSPRINAFGQPSGCFHCSGDHAVRDCHILNKAREYFVKRGYRILAPNKGKPSGSGSPARPPFNNRARGGSKPPTRTNPGRVAKKRVTHYGSGGRGRGGGRASGRRIAAMEIDGAAEECDSPIGGGQDDEGLDESAATHDEDPGNWTSRG